MLVLAWAGVWRQLWVLAFRTWNSDTEIWFFDIRLWENFKTIWQKGHPLAHFNILIASSNFCPTQYYPDEWIFYRNEIYLRGRYTTCFVYWFHINWRISFKSQFSDVKNRHRTIYTYLELLWNYRFLSVTPCYEMVDCLSLRCSI